MRQAALWKLPSIKADVVYTSINIASDIVGWCQPAGLCLDPCAGDFAFFNALPDPKLWCELGRGRDFFDFDEQVDWIVGNPPYSIFEEWLEHSFSLASDVVYIIPTNKVFQRTLIMDMIREWGGIKAMRVYGSGQRIGFDFGFSVGAFHFSKGWNGPLDLSYGY